MSSTASTQSDSASEPSVDNQSPAEVYAASAAEGAIRPAKESEIESDLTDLSETLKHASVSKSSPSPSVSKPDAGDVGSSSAVVVEPSKVAKQDDSRPTQTKEELIEEALNCPCIASMKEGSCGQPFLAAYRCFLESETEPKGMDCMEQFKSMQACVADHPEEYNLDDDDPDSDPFANASGSENEPSNDPNVIEANSP